MQEFAGRYACIPVCFNRLAVLVGVWYDVVEYLTTNPFSFVSFHTTVVLILYTTKCWLLWPAGGIALDVPVASRTACVHALPTLPN